MREFKQGEIQCAQDGKGWSFCNCEMRGPFFAVHIWSTMQTALTASAALITSTTHRQSCFQSVGDLYKELVHLLWANRNAELKSVQVPAAQSAAERVQTDTERKMIVELHDMQTSAIIEREPDNLTEAVDRSVQMICDVVQVD